MAWDRQITIKTPQEIDIMRAGWQDQRRSAGCGACCDPSWGDDRGFECGCRRSVAQTRCYSPFKNYPGPYPYPASTTISVNEELVHGIPGKRKLKEGDIVSVDCGTVL